MLAYAEMIDRTVKWKKFVGVTLDELLIFLVKQDCVECVPGFHSQPPYAASALSTNFGSNMSARAARAFIRQILAA